MIKAVLLDLDDTLLALDTNAFARAYLASLGEFLVKRHAHLATDRFHGAIRGAMKATMTRLDPAYSNEQTMNSALSVGLDLSSDQVAAAFLDFYTEGYGKLRGVAAPMDAAAETVEWLLGHDYKVVVATNPVFPRPATLDRLRWAGFEPDTVPFRLITTLESVHFTKPTPHYYEEILARIGVESEDAIMVGDSYENDIIPAHAAGLATFWLNHGEAAQPGAITPDSSGTLRDFLDKAASGWLHDLPPRPRTAAQIVPRMLGNLAALDGLTREIDPLSWNVRPFADEWTPLEILLHLVDSEIHVQRPQLLRILNEDNPFLPPSPTPPAPGQWTVAGQDGRQVMAQFMTERFKTLDLLRDLTPTQWARPARHSIFGPTTLQEMAHFTARHDRLHTNQLCETIGACVE